MENNKKEPIIEIKNVSKSFGGEVLALDNVSIAIYKNEIVGVVGENGAGKTTLMKILVGVYPPDSGELFYKNQLVTFPKNPKEAARRGISIVYQEKGVVPCLKVYQFLFLGHEDRYISFSGININKIKKHAKELLDEFKINCSIESFMYELPLSTQKLIEIAKAVLSLRIEHGRDKVDSVIILDEPTAPLTIEEREDLFVNLLKMKTHVSFIFVSHIMQEIMEFTDRVHVLRDGRLVANFNLKKEKVTEENLFKVIVGKDLIDSENKVRSNVDKDKKVLEIKSLSKKGCYYDISFDLFKGECIGIFGPAGSGKSEIINTIAGSLGFDNGIMMIKSKKIKNLAPPYSRLINNGVGYFSGETSKELFISWPISKNISIVNIQKILLKFFKFISFNQEKQLTKKIMDKLRIKAKSFNTECSSLSGGNKQKVSVGKWFERSPDILLLEDPTIGIDVGARVDIYDAVFEMKNKGISMILVSDDPKEYSALCDRIIFIKNGKIQSVLNHDEFKEVISA